MKNNIIAIYGLLVTLVLIVVKLTEVSPYGDSLCHALDVEISPNVESLPLDYSMRNDFTLHRFTNLYGNYSLLTPSSAVDGNTDELVKNNGIFEPFLFEIHSKISGQGLVLDFGSNVGDFSIYTALTGDEVVALEMVSDLRLCLKLSKYLNGVVSLSIPNYVISSQDGYFRYSLKSLSEDKQFGTTSPTSDGDHYAQVVRFQRTPWANRKIKMFKADIEGHVYDIFSALISSIRNRLVQHTVFELWVWELAILDDFLSDFHCQVINVSGSSVNDEFSPLKVHKAKVLELFRGRRNVFLNVWCRSD